MGIGSEGRSTQIDEWGDGSVTEISIDTVLVSNACILPVRIRPVSMEGSQDSLHHLFTCYFSHVSINACNWHCVADSVGR